MSETSSIILTGEVLPERDFGEVVSALARVLRTTEDVAATLLVGRETVIKRNVPNAEVERYLHVIGRAGAVVRAARMPPRGQVARGAGVVPEAPETPPVPESVKTPRVVAPPPKPVLALAEECVVCPECRHHQPKRMSCEKCGCDMDSVRAARERVEQEEKERVARESFKMPDALPVDAVDRYEEVRAPGALGIWANGRIGRLRLLAYLWPVLVLLGLLAVIAAQTFLSRETGGGAPRTIAIVMVAAVLGVMAYVRVALSRGKEFEWKWLIPFVLLLLCASLVLGLGKSVGKAGSVPAVIAMLTLTIVPVCLWLSMRLLALRMHDIDLSGKWLLLLLVLPLAGALIGRPGFALFGSSVFWIAVLLLTLLPGSNEENGYGDPCKKNTLAVKVGAAAVVGLLALGIVSARMGMKAYEERVASAGGGGVATPAPAPDFSNPVYAEIRMLWSLRDREIEMVYLGKMSSEADCVLHSEAVANDMVRGCKRCEVKTRICKQLLQPREQLMFQEAQIHSAYVSLRAIDDSEREWRVVLWGLTAADAEIACKDVAKALFKTRKGAVACIPGAPS